MIVELNNGLFIEDDKTASQLGSKWANQWEMRSQFSGYTWAEGITDGRLMEYSFGAWLSLKQNSNVLNISLTDLSGKSPGGSIKLAVTLSE